MNGECVNAGRQLIRKCCINHAVALDPGLTFEDFSHNIDPVMSLPAFPVPGMACMLVRFILNLEALGRESLGQLLCDGIGGSHRVELGDGRLLVNPDSLF
jgi:hypothetical protein